MNLRATITAAALACACSTAAFAQAPVLASANADALFTSPDPALHANKQVAYHIIRDLLEAGHWDRADQYLSEEYIQHNPNVASGRAAVVNFFTQVLKVQPQPIPDKMKTAIASVVAEGDLVIVAYPRTVRDAKQPAGAYSTTWFDMWRIRDGKAVEHWDSALMGEAP
ncbi:nuclear transport factor 2 family protein [Ideonella sp. DXS29W]|uniref:Nuclear transport factor 2 family protein n=1 Tax=Ideonella lacteola TaxID=2984193 RepID=A0ABU9BJ75_9BURK